MKNRILAAVLGLCALSLTACSATTATVVATLGISGAALSAYCAASGVGCSPALVDYASLIVSQATQDATILESGQSTTAEIEGVVVNLNAALQSGAALPGLNTAEQNEVKAISAAGTELIALVQALLTKAPPVAASAATAAIAAPAATAVMALPKLSSADSKNIATMRARVAALPAK